MSGQRCALVTGASRGIGFAIARALAEEGYGLTVSARRPGPLQEARDMLAPDGGDVLAIEGNAADEESLDALVSAHEEHFGRLDVLVANAGTGTAGSLIDYPTKALDRSLNVNVRAPLLLAQRALPMLRDAGASHGQAWIVIVSSITGKTPAPELAVYSATKAALVSLAHSLNQEHAAADRVRTTALCPGYVDTGMSEWVHDRIPPERMIRPEDLGEAVRFLLRLSPETVVPEIPFTRLGAAWGQA